MFLFVLFVFKHAQHLPRVQLNFGHIIPEQKQVEG